jgi:hypothetical protein
MLKRTSNVQIIYLLRGHCCTRSIGPTTCHRVGRPELPRGNVTFLHHSQTGVKAGSVPSWNRGPRGSKAAILVWRSLGSLDPTRRHPVIAISEMRTELPGRLGARLLGQLRARPGGREWLTNAPHRPPPARRTGSLSRRQVAQPKGAAEAHNPASHRPARASPEAEPLTAPPPTWDRSARCATVREGSARARRRRVIGCTPHDPASQRPPARTSPEAEPLTASPPTWDRSARCAAVREGAARARRRRVIGCTPHAPRLPSTSPASRKPNRSRPRLPRGTDPRAAGVSRGLGSSKRAAGA